MELEALFDAVIVKPLEEEETTYGSIVVPDLGKDRNEHGTVVAVGPGREVAGIGFVKTIIKKGDIVILPTMGFTKLEHKGDEYYIGSENTVLAKINKISSLDEVLKDATLNLGFELRDVSTTSKGVKDVMTSLNVTADTNFLATGLTIDIVDDKTDKEGYRKPTDAEINGNFSNVNINGLTPRPVYDPSTGITNFKVQGTFETKDGKETIQHSFEAWLNPNTPMLQQIWEGAKMPEVTPTLLELGKLTVKNQVVVPKKLQEFGAKVQANVGIIALPGGGYGLVELEDGSVNPKYKNGKLVVIKSEAGNNIIYPTLNAMSNYIENDLTKEE